MKALPIATALLATLVAGGPAAAAPAVHTIVLDRMKFGPSPTNLRAGDTILWINKDPVRHTATARDGSFSVDLPAKGSARTLVKRKGAIPFFCRFHPGMNGVLAVR